MSIAGRVSCPPACVIRSPWPDEFPRLRAAFPGAPLDRGADLFLAVTAVAGIERIVGVGGVFSPASRSAEMFFLLRPRFHESSTCAALLAALSEHARSLGAATLLTSAELPLDPAVARALQRHRFSVHRRFSTWMTPVQAVGRHIGRLAARLASRRGMRGLRAEPLAPDDLSRVRALFARDGLAPDAGPDSPRSFSTARFDPSLSFVVRFEGGLAGALLCRALSRSSIGISAEAIDRTATVRAPEVHLALLEALLSAATRRAVSELVCTLPAERHSHFSRLARRSGGIPGAEFVQLARSLG